MPVNDRDVVWSEHKPERDKVDDLFQGRETATKHVRGLPGWDKETLGLIAEGVYFLPIVARTVETFGGLVFMKPPQRTLPESLTAYLDDVTQTGQEIDRFAEQALDGVMLTGAVAVLVDYPMSEVSMTRAEAEKVGRRPVLKLYDAETILAARKTVVNGVLKLTHVRLLEATEVEEAGDRFKTKIMESVRCLDLIDGQYQVTVYTNGEGGWVPEPVVIPLLNGSALDHIPCYFSNTRDGEARPAKPPLTDLADINIAHLNNSAQYEWALAWLGSPILFGAGITLPEGSTIQMGASAAIVTDNADATLSIVQADSSKFSGLKTAMDDKRRDAAAMGARMLLESSRAAVTAETSRIEKAGETSVVVSMANAVSQCLTNAIRMLALWAGVSGAEGGLYWLNDKLLPETMTAPELTALLAAWQAGAISEQELYAKLQAGEVIDGSKTFEEHQDELIAEQPDPEGQADLEAALGGDPDAVDPEANRDPVDEPA